MKDPEIKAAPAGAFWMSAADLSRRYSVSVITIWVWAAKPDFPAPVRFTNKCTRWSLADIEAWEGQLKNAQHGHEVAA